MSYESDNPHTVTDVECEPPYAVARYARVEQAQWFLSYLRENGGTAIRAKADRGGYEVRNEEVSHA